MADAVRAWTALWRQCEPSRGCADRQLELFRNCARIERAAVRHLRWPWMVDKLGVGEQHGADRADQDAEASGCERQSTGVRRSYCCSANMRSPYPGEAGQRNQFRGDGYFDVDLGLHKGFHFGDRYLLNLAGEVFNLTNTTRFDVHSLDTGSTDGPQMGVYSATLTQYRRVQVSARFQF